MPPDSGNNRAAPIGKGMLGDYGNSNKTEIVERWQGQVCIRDDAVGRGREAAGPHGCYTSGRGGV